MPTPMPTPMLTPTNDAAGAESARDTTETTNLALSAAAVLALLVAAVLITRSQRQATKQAPPADQREFANPSYEASTPAGHRDSVISFA